MKKRLRIPLIVAACLAVFLLGFLLAGMIIPRSFNALPHGGDYSPPVQTGRSFTLVYEGDYPGFADVPVTAEQAASSRRLMYALREQKYTWCFPLLRPRESGLAIYELRGCTPECKAYWDGRYLWLPVKYEGPWRGYSPADPKGLDEKLNTIYTNEYK